MEAPFDLTRNIRNKIDQEVINDKIAHEERWIARTAYMTSELRAILSYLNERHPDAFESIKIKFRK